MRSIPAYAQRAFVEYVSAHAAKGDEDAKRILAKLPKRKANDKRTPSRQQARREERNARAAEIRAKVMERAGGNCEWCGAAGLRLELHHVISGGARRSAESVDTCAAICPDCHRLLHRNEGAALTLARIWAERGSYSVALKAIRKRAAKVEEARRVA